MPDAQNEHTTAPPRHGTRAYREVKHAEYVGPLAFELGTDFARIIVQGLTAFAHVTPLEKAALDRDHKLRMRMDAFEDTPRTDDPKRSGDIYMRRPNDAQLAELAPGVTGGLAVWTTDVMGTPLIKKEGYEIDPWALLIPDEFYEELQAKDDPYWWTDAIVALTLGYALMAHRDGEKTEHRHGIAYEFEGIPKRLLFLLCRDYNDPHTRERWSEVRDMASRIYFRGQPLISRAPTIECGHLDAKRLGPFNGHELEAWIVSRHVLENATKVDDTLAQRSAPDTPRNKLPAHPDHTSAPSARGAAKITPDIFHGTLLDLPVQLALQVHFRFNRSNKRTLTLEQIQISSGRAMWRRRKKPRPARQRARIERVALAGVARGLWSRRVDAATGQDLPVLVRATMRTQHASYRVLLDPGRF